MTDTALMQNHHFDAISEASTDGDDNYKSPGFSSASGKKKLCPKNKAKSSLCRNFSEKGFCPYGLKCQFAHGIEELRCNVDENSYKTKPCNSFWRKGHCSYGLRCNFSHSQCQENSVAPKEERLSGSLKSFRDIIYESKTLYGSRLATILE